MAIFVAPQSTVIDALCQNEYAERRQRDASKAAPAQHPADQVTGWLGGHAVGPVVSKYQRPTFNDPPVKLLVFAVTTMLVVAWYTVGVNAAAE